MNVGADRVRYQADREKDVRLSATEGIDAVMKANQLDALLFPGTASASIAAKPGYPTVIVPFAFAGAGRRAAGPGTGPARRLPARRAARRGRAGRGESAFPEGFNPKPSPVRRELHRDGVRRAEAHRDRVRLRAGDEEARAAEAIAPSRA